MGGGGVGSKSRCGNSGQEAGAGEGGRARAGQGRAGKERVGHSVKWKTTVVSEL